MLIGEKIKALRKNKGYTLEKLAELSDCTDAYISKTERGKIYSPSSKILLKIARALGVTMDYLAGDTVNYDDAVDDDFCSKYRQMSDREKREIRLWVEFSEIGRNRGTEK
jgi:transcriptional regulator with XRE-family HTH domain